MTDKTPELMKMVLNVEFLGYLHSYIQARTDDIKNKLLIASGDDVIALQGAYRELKKLYDLRENLLKGS